ncbi:uncharacterized protein LOC134248412, partial [Saccostrea cucullata]|uniref:uncharacterized protein LOC134248412 n=1 Tax=Saccostrea cuccullata TaxID=36930 RepID=UPI002ED0EDD3
AKEWVNRGKHKVFNFTLDIVAGTGTDIPDDWLQDDNAKNPEKSEPFDSKQDHTSSSGEPESMTSKIPLASGPQTATFEQNSSKSGVPPMYYPTYPSMPMADAMEPPSYDSHNFQYGSQSMQTPQSAQIHVLYSKEEKPSFDKCPVKTPAEDNLSNQKNIQEEKQTSDAYDSIKICNLPGSITDDSISDYFENVKRSGGGPVSKVIYDEERKTAFVTFEDPN